MEFFPRDYLFNGKQITSFVDKNVSKIFQSKIINSTSYRSTRLCVGEEQTLVKFDREVLEIKLNKNGACESGPCVFGRSGYELYPEMVTRTGWMENYGIDTNKVGYEVTCYMADVGQDDDFEAAKVKAKKIGAKEVIVDDLKREFVENYVWPAVKMGLIYEGRYLLGTSLARPCISVGLVKAALRCGASHVAHGATGKGNDQVRFELSCYALCPTLQVIAPWRIREFTSRFQGRNDLLEYAEVNGVPVPVTPKAPWSMDANMMHVSYESGILEDPSLSAPGDLYQLTKDPQDAPDTPARIEIRFLRGLPSAVRDLSGKGGEIKNPVEIFRYLNKIAGEHGVGRIDIVENRFIGLKSRGVYETPGGTVLYTAHQDLETLCLDREVLRLKQRLRDDMALCCYNGLWFSPEADLLRHCLDKPANDVTGTVVVELYKGCVRAVARSSPSSLYNQRLSSMNEHSTLTPWAASGFIEVQAVRLKEYYRVHKH